MAKGHPNQTGKNTHSTRSTQQQEQNEITIQKPVIVETGEI